MFKTHKGIILIASVIVLTVFIYYRYSVRVLQVNKGDDTVPMATIPDGTKKVSAEATYMATEDKQDTLRFVLTLDKDGIITDVATLDPETNATPEKKKAFNQSLSVMIKGKKLSEITSVDNVASSTHTTTAFNSVIDKLKAQL